MKVLLLVDIQNDFCPGGSLPVPEGDKVVGVANELIRSGKFDAVIASKDWHPREHLSFAANHKSREIGDVIKLGDLNQRLWPTHCVANSRGAEFHPDLNTNAIQWIVLKGTNPLFDSYSAFFDNSKRVATGLHEYLKGLSQGKPIELTVCGLATDYCVKATALDARELGYKTVLVVDGCRAVNIDPQDELLSLREMTKAGVKIVTARELVPALSRSTARAHGIALSA